MKKFIEEFKEFAMQGNVVDMAVGVVIGGAFGAIVNSLVNDIITPLISLLIGSANFEHLSITVGEASINYGLFLQAILNFLIISFSIFTVIRALNRIKGEELEEEVEEKTTPSEAELLEAILIELQNNKK